MCGIVGLVTRDTARLRDVGPMTDAIRHRGPDDEGYLFASSASGRTQLGRGRDSHKDAPGMGLSTIEVEPFDIAFGHRRLSILDLSIGGHQPMSTKDGRFWITYNGEIYNYIELRTELRALGFEFVTASDSEVLLAAFQAWGLEALPRLNGMWAFAILDLTARRLFLSRDRFGEKPLLYHHDPSLFAFASEPAALLACRGIAGRVDERSFSSFLLNGAIEEDERTFFDGILRVPQGGLVTLDLADMKTRTSRWYELPSPAEREVSVEEFRASLDDAVKLRLRSDVPVGTCLSGGIDSSAITAISALQLKGGAYHAFSAVYADEGFSEAAYVKDAVLATGVIDHLVTPDGATLRADLVDLVRTQGEPLPSLGAYTQYCIARAASAAGVKVLLDGQGADELLAGYHYQAGPYLSEVWGREGLAAFMRQAGVMGGNMERSPLWLGALAAYHHFPWPEAVRSAVKASGATHAVLPARAASDDFRQRAEVGRKHGRARNVGEERRRSLVTSSLPALLRYEDRNTMRFSVEARLPFLDFRLVDLAFRIPSAHLFRGGWTKSILRDAVSDLLPSSITRRKNKLGFATPEARLFREASGAVRDVLRDAGDLGGRLEPEFVRSLLSGDDLQIASRPFLARWCTSAIWLREFVKAPRA